MNCDVFFISESTGITADELGSSLLSQFPQFSFTKRYHPFIDTIEKAEALVARINEVAESQTVKPLVFATMANKNINKILGSVNANYYELFDGYVVRLGELNQEYKRLSVELTENGPNELTVSALIDNLKLRLNLLYRLKEQIS